MAENLGFFGFLRPTEIPRLSRWKNAQKSLILLALVWFQTDTHRQMETKDLKIEKIFSASPDKVFEAWTNPDFVKKWFSPFPGVDAEIREFNAIPGGKASILVKDHGGEPLIFFLNYLSVDPTEIDFTVRGKEDGPESPVMKVYFQPEGMGTKMMFESPQIPADRYEDASRGWYAFFGKLTQVLGESFSN